MKTTIEIHDEGVDAALARLLAFGQSPRLYLEPIKNLLIDSTRLRFREARSPEGAPWAALSPVTIARRRRGSSRPLLDTGALRNSITGRVTGNELIVGTNKRQAPMLHFGARKGQFGRGRYRTKRGSFPIPWGNVPPRPIFGLSAEDRSGILDILASVATGEKS